jgi:hypothetical protein
MRRTKTGTLSAALDTVVLSNSGDSLATILLSGTHTGVTVQIEGSPDGSNWDFVGVYKPDSLKAEYGAITIATNGTKAWHVILGGLAQIRVKCTAISTGSVSVYMITGPSKSIPTLGSVEGTYNLINKNVARKVGTVAAGSGAADVVVSATGPGILHRVIVTTAGSAAISLYDHGSATAGLSPLFTSAATYTLGTVTELNIPFTNGLVALQASGSAAVTIGYSLL